MAGCDSWVIFKILELGLSIACVIYKRVTDDQASRLFFYLTKISREWPLLNNITWDQNGAIFTDVTYIGFIFISTGLLLGHCTGELNYCKKMETYFLVIGALSYIVVGAIELAAIEWVPDDLIDNAAILGTISLVTAFVFIVDLLSAATRRKKTKTLPKISGVRFEKGIQTEDRNTTIKEIYANGDANGYIINGFSKVGDKKIPKNSVKILPTEDFQIPVKNSNNEFVGTVTPFSKVYTPTELEKPENQLKSTESFLKNEKGEVVRLKRDRSVTPPGYSKIEPKIKNSDIVVPKGYVMIPIDELNVNQLKKLEETNDEKSRKLQSPTVTTTVRTPQSYHQSRAGTPSEYKMASPQSPRHPHHSSGSEESIPTVSFRISGKDSKKLRSKTPSPYSDDSPSQDVPAMYQLEYPQKKYTKEPKQYGKLNNNRAYSEDDIDSRNVGLPFQRNSPLRSSNFADRPRSRSREEKKKAVNYTDDNFSSLDSRKIADDLKHLKDITSSNIDIAELERENQKLKESLKKEQEEKYQLKTDLKLKNVEQKLAELDDRKNLERRIGELEQLRHELKLAKGFRDTEEERRIEMKIKEMEDEKDRRMSEKEELYFGLVDLRKSQKDASPDIKPKVTDLEEYFRSEAAKRGVHETNKKLKEKTKEEEEIKKVIDDGFHFLEDERRKPLSPQKSEGYSAKKKVQEQLSAPDLTSIYQKQTDRYMSRPKELQSSSERLDDKWRSKSPAPTRLTPDSDESSKPETASFKSEAQFWLSSEPDDDVPDGEVHRGETPSSPQDPGFVLHVAKTWEEKASPTDRFGFSSKKAQHLKMEQASDYDKGRPVLKYDDESKIPQRIIEFIEFEHKKDSPKAQLLENEEIQASTEKVQGRRSGMLVRKVDFPDNVTVREIRAIPTSPGSTSTWKKWLQPKQKLSSAKSSPA